MAAPPGGRTVPWWGSRAALGPQGTKGKRSTWGHGDTAGHKRRMDGHGTAGRTDTGPRDGHEALHLRVCQLLGRAPRVGAPSPGRWGPLPMAPQRPDPAGLRSQLQAPTCPAAPCHCPRGALTPAGCTESPRGHQPRGSTTPSTVTSTTGDTPSAWQRGFAPPEIPGLTLSPGWGSGSLPATPGCAAVMGLGTLRVTQRGAGWPTLATSVPNLSSCPMRGLPGRGGPGGAG